MILSVIEFIEITTAYTIPSVAGKTTRLYNSSANPVTVTTPEATAYTLEAGGVRDYWYDGAVTRTVNPASLGDTAINGTLDVTGNTALTGTLGVTGAATLDDNLDVGGAATVGGTLGVTGNASLAGTLGVTGATTVGGTLKASGACATPPATQTVSASATVTVGDTNQLIAFDTSGGDISPDIEDGNFIGQHIDFYTTGSKKAKIGGTGFYTNRVWQTSNTGLCGATWTGSEWRVNNQSTAEFEDGDEWKLKYNSDGTVLLIAAIQTAYFTTTSNGNLYFRVYTFIFPITLSSPPDEGDVNFMVRQEENITAPGGLVKNSMTESQCKMHIIGSAATASGRPAAQIVGKY